MRVPSGVPGFDALVEGGFPGGAAVVVQGPAGREKDTFLLQFVAEGLRRGASVLVVLSSVSPAKFQLDLRDAGVDVHAAVRENRLKFVDWFTYKEEAVQDVEADGPTFRASIDLANVGIAISRAIAGLPREGEKRAALEILSPALSVYDLPNVYGFAQSTKAKLERFGFTSLFVLQKEMHDERTLSSLHQPFDGVVDVERVREGDELVRRVAVLSLKGTAAQSKYVPVEIGPDGVLRVSAASDRERTLRKQEELIRSNPKDPKLWLATARNLRSMGENERALKCVDAALNLDEHDADAWRLKAELLEAMGRKEDAEKARTHVSAPPGPTGKKEDAATRLLRVVGVKLRENPRDPDALFVKAAALAQMGSEADAIAALDALILVDDAYPGLWVLKAKLHARRGEREKAKESRLRALDVEKRQERLARERETRRIPPPPPPETVFECPECGASVGEHDTKCPSCGVLFEGVEETRPRETPPPMPKPEIARRGLTNGLAREAPRGVGRTNGLVNGTRGRTNGLVNGTRGRTNGLVNGTRGRTNGLTNGLVNGLLSLRSGMTNGLTNGSGFTNGLGSQRFIRESRRNRWKIFLIPLVFAALVSLPLFNPDLGRPPGPQIDGRFDDWSGVPGQSLAGTAADPNIRLTRVAIVNQSEALFLLVEVQGQILAGGPNPPSLMDTIFVFVDDEQVASTGYAIRGLGADRLLEIRGVGGTVRGANLFRFSQSIADRRDWRGWSDPAPILAAASGNRIELAVDRVLLGASPRGPALLVASQGWNGATDFADLHIGVRGGLVRAVQRAVAPAILSGSNAALLAVDLTAVGGPASVSSLAIDLLGTALLSDIGLLRLLDSTGSSLGERTPVGRTVSFSFPAVTLDPGTTQTWMVAAAVSGSDGTTLGARIASPYDVGAEPAVVTLTSVGTGERLGYIGRIPSVPIVDGGFAEWTNDTADAAGEPSTGGNPSVDVGRFGVAVGTSNLTFHVGLRGPAFAGTVLTTTPTSPPTEGGSPAASDRDRDTVPDSVDTTYPDDFNNDGIPDASTGGDVDGDGVRDYTDGGADLWLNTTIPASFPTPYAGRNVSVYIGPSSSPPVIGTDNLRLFVDADNVSATGYYVAGIGADYLLEVEGREGLVSSAVLSAHASPRPGDWIWTKVSDLSLAMGLDQFEARGDLTAVVPSPAMYLEISDWRGGRDALGLGTRGATRSAPLFTGPDPSFVRTDGGAFAYRSTGTSLEAYARATRGPDSEIVLRYGSLFLGWRTTGLGGEDRLENPVSAPVQAAGRDLVLGGFPDAWEQYEIDGLTVKHNVWLESAPPTASALVSLAGDLTIPQNASVLVDGRSPASVFDTAGAITVAYDGHTVRFEPPFAFEARRPDLRVAGRYQGQVLGSTVRLSMTIPASWLQDPARTFPVVLDPTATGIVDTSTQSAAVGGPHPRNVIYDGTYFWAFFYDGTNIKYEPSSDGLSWVNAKNTAFTTTLITKVSAWFHDAGATKIVYIVGDKATKDVLVRRGTISGTAITWTQGTDQTITDISISAVGKTPFVTRDTSGYIWVATNTKEGVGQFNFAAVRSTNTDDVTAWNARTVLTSNAANDFHQAIILPLASGDMYALWYADGTIGGKRYTASNSTWWTNGDTIDTTTAGVLTKAPSAVVDGSYNIHLVYVDSSGAVKYRQRTSSWGSATTLDSASGNTYATISRDTGTGDLYVFYISSALQIKAQKYSGSWSSVTLETNTRIKSHLTSIYDVGSASNIAWTWSQSALGGSYDVKFSVLSTSVDSRTIDTSTDNIPVAYNHQRKVFHDGAYFWAFYYDGADTAFTYSADAATWEGAVVKIFATSGIDNASVWFHDTGSSKIAYVVGDDSLTDKTLYVRRCTISGTTWTCGTAYTPQLSLNNLGNLVSFISRDSSGYLWIISNCAVTASTYDVCVKKSNTADDPSSFPAGDPPRLLSAAISANYIFPVILPMSGGNLYALWYADGNIDGKKYTGSWGSLENVATTTASVRTKIPSTTVDSSDNVDTVYINSTGAVQHKQRTASWGSADTVDSASGNIAPTLTRESSTGDLYTFYLQSTYQIKGRKNSSGSWSDVTGIDTSTITKYYLSSPYTVNAAWKVGWIWDQGAQGTAGTFEVKIERIPEFGDALLPIAATAVLGLAISRWRRRRPVPGPNR